MHQFHKNQIKHKRILPAAVIIFVLLAMIFFVSLSWFLRDYRKAVYERIIDSNISALKETTGTLISKTTSGFGNCQHEVRMLGIGMSEHLKKNGFSSEGELSEEDRNYILEFEKASVFDYCVLLNDAGRGVYSDGNSVKPINLYSSQAYVDCISSSDGEAISFISDPFGAAGKDVVAFSSRAGSVILIGIYSQDSFEALYDSATFGDSASYLITTSSGLILSSAHVTPKLEESLNLFTYIGENPKNEGYFLPDRTKTAPYDRMVSDFENGESGRGEFYFEDSRYELVYAPIPYTSWNFVSCVAYDHITADAVEINQKTVQLTVIIITLMFGLFLIIVCMLVFVVRAHASKEAVRRDRIFTLMTHYVPNVILIADSISGDIEYASNNTDQVLGISGSFANILEDRIFRCIHSDDRQKVLDLIRLVRTGGSMSESMVLRFTRPDTGAEIILGLNGYLISEKDSSQRFITLTIEDITERVRSRERLEEALVNEERANAAKSTFLASMSHDIRTPLNAITGLTSLALQYPEDIKKVTECLQKIANSSQLLLGLINDVLDMSRIESGQMQLAETEFELGEWLERVITVTQSQTSVRGQRFDVDAWDIRHELLCGDVVRLGQVLTNVLGNAVKFTRKGGEIHLEIREVPSEEPGRAAFCFVVSDTGIGMSREYMDHIFEMFTRDRNSYSSGIQGTGLGMAITKRIVDMMGGTIRVESELNKGTTFTVELSLRISGREFPQAPHCGMIVIANPGSRERCVDAVRKLDAIGVEAVWETDYAAAVALARTKRESGRPFDLAFLPYKLFRSDPSLDGRRIQKDLGDQTKLLLGLKPDEAVYYETRKQQGITQTIPLPLFHMSLYRKITVMLGESEALAENPAGMLKGLSILLVEDNPINQEIAVEMLSGLMAAKVDPAGNGEEGCNRFLTAPPQTYDVILMDLQMPVLGGLDAAKKIRASSHSEAGTIPIIALTANAFEEDRREAADAGMDGFVSKPIDFDVLAREVFRVCRKLHGEDRDAAGGDKPAGL